MNILIPPSRYQYGETVIVVWNEAECPDTKAIITGVNFDHRSDSEPTYTITEVDGSQTDGIPASMIR